MEKEKQTLVEIEWDDERCEIHRFRESSSDEQMTVEIWDTTIVELD